MINQKLINPASIVVVGGSDDTSKPGGKIVQNLLDGRFRGELRIVNPRSQEVQGIKTFPDIVSLPETDLAVLAIPAKLCPEAVEILAREKKTGAFIILSAGFGEESAAGKEAERKIADTVSSVGATLIGPNCIGVINSSYSGVFTTPVPPLSPSGVDFVSGSGATAVFIMESALPNGLPFSSVWSVGNSAHTGVEDILEYLDDTYVPGKSSHVKLLYLENISDPARLLKHSLSLRSKGCRIAAIKSGTSEAGSRAASSHTGALASSDLAVDALFRKAGIIRCHSRSELAAVAAVAMHRISEGNRMAVITHAGGPAVMLTDALSKNGFEVPAITGAKAEELKAKLHPGSSVGNPVDFLATGTAEQLGQIIDACDNDFDNIDSMAVIFGSPGLFAVDDVYKLLSEKMRSCKKPVYPILPSVVNVGREIGEFIKAGNINFPDEVVFANALGQVKRADVTFKQNETPLSTDTKTIREVIGKAGEGYLSQADVAQLLDAAGIPRVKEEYAVSPVEAAEAAARLGYPVVMKVAGPVHKSDIGGVALNLKSRDEVEREYARMKGIPGFTGVTIQRMASGTELFAGVNREDKFGHLLLLGLGGIFIEVLKDFSASLVPVGTAEAETMIRSLRGYGIIEGVRGKAGVSVKKYAEIVSRLSALVVVAPEICELDLNPLLGNGEDIVAVDARIKISKG